MSLRNNIKDVKSSDDFSFKEIELIIKVMSTAMFPIKEIEPMYQLLIKLQKKYENLKS